MPSTMNFLEFEIYIMDWCAAMKPKTCSDLERFSAQLHQRIEIAIEDYIRDNDLLDLDDYNAQY